MFCSLSRWNIKYLLAAENLQERAIPIETVTLAHVHHYLQRRAEFWDILQICEVPVY